MYLPTSRSARCNYMCFFSKKQTPFVPPFPYPPAQVIFLLIAADFCKPPVVHLGNVKR